MINLSSFDWNSIRVKVWSQIAEIDFLSIDGADVKVRFCQFTAKLFVQSSRTQNQKCRTFQELSNGIHVIKFNYIVFYLFNLKENWSKSTEQIESKRIHNALHRLCRFATDCSLTYIGRHLAVHSNPMLIFFKFQQFFIKSIPGEEKFNWKIGDI